MGHGASLGHSGSTGSSNSSSLSLSTNTALGKSGDPSHQQTGHMALTAPSGILLPSSCLSSSSNSNLHSQTVTSPLIHSSLAPITTHHPVHHTFPSVTGTFYEPSWSFESIPYSSQAHQGPNSAAQLGYPSSYESLLQAPSQHSSRFLSPIFSATSGGNSAVVETVASAADEIGPSPKPSTTPDKGTSTHESGDAAGAKDSPLSQLEFFN